MKNTASHHIGRLKLSPALRVYMAITLLLASLPLIAAPFTDNGDGTVTDQKTNLVWQKCTKDQATQPTCTGLALQATWVDALAYCNSLTLAGKTAGQWRLPSVNELNSIVDESVVNPSINATFFPATIVSNYYWTSTTKNAALGTSAWAITFTNGYVAANAKTGLFFVRCVAGP